MKECDTCHTPNSCAVELCPCGLDATVGVILIEGKAKTRKKSKER